MAEPGFYRLHVFACINERAADHPRGSCARQGAVALRNQLKALAKEAGLTDVRINQSGCLDRCEVGPCVVIYPEGVWYRISSAADVEAVVQEHLVQGRVVDALRLPDHRIPPEPGAEAAADQRSTP